MTNAATDLHAVTKEEFNAYVGPRDIVVYVTPDHTDWETRDRVLVGRTIPGDVKSYFLARPLRKAAS